MRELCKSSLDFRKYAKLSGDSLRVIAIGLAFYSVAAETGVLQDYETSFVYKQPVKSDIAKFSMSAGL